MGAVAGMMGLTASLGSAPIEFAYRGYVDDTGNGPNFSFSVPAAMPTNCLMVVAVGQEGCGSITSLSGGGYTWTKVATTGLVGTQADGQEAAIFATEITTKPSSVTMACNNEGFRANAAFYSVINHTSATPIATDNAGATSVTSRSITLNNLQDGDAVIAYCAHARQGTLSFTGITRDFSTTTSENLSTFASASDYKSGDGSLGITATGTGAQMNNNYMNLVAAAWR